MGENQNVRKKRGRKERKGREKECELSSRTTHYQTLAQEDGGEPAQRLCSDRFCLRQVWHEYHFLS